MKAAFKGKMYEGPVDPLPKDRGIRVAFWAVVFCTFSLLAYAGAWLPMQAAYPFDLSVLMPWHNPPGPFPAPPVAPVAQFTTTGEMLDVGDHKYRPYAVTQMIHGNGDVTYQAAAVPYKDNTDANAIIFTASGANSAPLVADPAKDQAARADLLKRLRAERR